jgi:tripartite-type tricarboxylate transporter receptor subunit TctC
MTILIGREGRPCSAKFCHRRFRGRLELDRPRTGVRAGLSEPPELPELPTIAESGYREFLATYWNDMLAPAGTPPAIVEKLNAAINASLQTAEMRASVTKLGMVPRIATTRELAALIASEYGKWLAVAKAADIKVE